VSGAPPIAAAPQSDGAAAELWRLCAVLVLCAWPAIVGIASPNDLELHDQGKQAMYVVGALQGDWLVPHDRGDVASKPPLYTWLAALGAAAFGLDEVTVRLPSVLAMLVLGFATYAIGRRLLDPTAALIGVALLATLQHLTKLAFFARTDMLLSAFIALALLAWVARRDVAFWACVGLATLTKGPAGLAVPLAAVAIDLAARRDLAGLRALRPLRGLAIVAGLLALWLVPAFALHWDEMRQMFALHLVDQLTNTGIHEGAKSQPFWYLVAYYFVKLLPWALLLPVALRRHGRPRDPAFLLVAWVAGGLFVFLFPPNKRPDHLLPMYAPGALLAGSVIADWLRGSLPEAAARAVALGARGWALGASFFALLAVPAAWIGLIHTTVSPPLWAFGAGLLALLPLRGALRAHAEPRALLVAALAGQALLGLAWAQTLSAPAQEGHAPDARRFVAAAERVAPRSDLVLCQVQSWEVPFLLQRNDAPLPFAELPRLAGEPTPHWVVMPESLLATWAADPAAFGGRPPPPVAARTAEGRPPERADLVLVRLGGETGDPGGDAGGTGRAVGPGVAL
jgi:4-amino-4-deoxy-L-arabinose transferase-like glycosyltransferase